MRGHGGEGIKKEIKIGYGELDARGKFIRTLWGGPLILAFLYWAVAEAKGHPDFDNVYFRFWIPFIATLATLGDIVYEYLKWKKDEKSKQ